MLIQNDETLRRFIPNTLVTVQGETTLYDKMQVELSMSEMWLTRLVGDNLASHTDTDIVLKLIATDAFLRAVPSLDLVLTPNGFGIVSNNTIAPASRDRVDRLLASLEHNRDTALEELLHLLLQVEEWRATAQGRYFMQTLFQTPFSIPADLRQRHAFDYFQQSHSQLVLIETELADKFISHPVYERLRNDIGNPDFAVLVAPLQAIELQLLTGKPLPYKQLIALVDYIRQHPDTFPEWQTSPTAELYKPHYFENDKHAAGYWW